MKKTIIATALAVLVTSSMAEEKIDINQYDMISVFKNAPASVEQGEKSGAKFTNDGVNPYKIIDKALSCKELGFTKYTKKDFSDFGYVRYHYTKMVKNDVEAFCNEDIYKGGTKNFSILIDGND